MNHTRTSTRSTRTGPWTRIGTRILTGSIATTCLLGGLSAQAAAFIWDAASGDGATITDGAGTWQVGVGNWFDQTNTLADQIWSDGNDAIFGGGTLGAFGTVTLGGAITAGSITFNTPNGGGAYTIDTSTFGLTLNTGITVNESATIQSGVGGSIILGADNIWSVASTKTLTVSSAVSGGFALTKTGAGTLILSAANTYTGVTSVNAGVLRLNHLTALPGGLAAGLGTGSALTLNGGVIGLGSDDFLRTLGTGLGQVQFTGSGGFAAYGSARNVNLGGAAAAVTWGAGSFVPDGSELILGAADADNTVTFMNPIALGAGSRTVRVEDGSAANDATLSGVISGTGGSLTKTGSGRLTLGAGNTYTGATLVSQGILTANGNNRIADASQVTVAAGATLEIANDRIGSLSGAGSVITTAAQTLFIDNNLGDTLFSGQISGPGNLRKEGINIQELTGDNTFTGSTLLFAGELGALKLSGGGKLSGTTSIDLQFGTTFIVGAAADVASVSDRLNNAATLTMRQNSVLALNGGADAATVDEQVGNVTLLDGRSTVTLTPVAGQQVNLIAGTLTRSVGNLLHVLGTGLGAAAGPNTTHLTFSAAPTLTGGGTGAGTDTISILPYGLGALNPAGTANSFVTYDNTLGIRPLDLLGTEYSSAVAGAGTQRNVNLTGPETLAANQSINALRLAGGALTVNSGVTLTLGSGALLAYDASHTITGGTLAFGTAEAVVQIMDDGANDARTLTINSRLSGSGGLMMSGNNSGSILELNQSSIVNGATTFSGPVAVSGGQIKMGAENVLYGSALTVNSGSKLILNSFSQTIGDLSGAGAIEDAATGATPVLTINQTGTTTYSGVIGISTDRTIAVTKTGAGTLTLTANQNLNGEFRIEGGRVELSGGGLVDDTTTFRLAKGGVLELANASGAGANSGARISNSATLFSRGGTFEMTENNGAVNYSETIGTLNLQAGHTTVTNGQAAASQTSTMTFTNALTRSAGASVNFTGTGLGDNTQNRIVFTAAPTLDDGIIGGWATVGNEFATWDTVATAGSIRALQTYTTTAENTWVATDNVKLSVAVASTTTLTGPRSVNSLNLVVTGTAGTDPILALAGNTLTIESGGLILSGTDNMTISTTAGGQVTVGPGAASLYELAARVDIRTLVISAPINDNGANPISIVKSGSGTLQIQGANNFSGTAYVNQGNLLINSTTAVDADNAIVINGGALLINVATTIKSLAGDSGTVRPNAAVARTLTLNGASGSTTFSGTLQDQGAGVFTLIKSGASTQVLDGTNTYTGTTTINTGGILQFGKQVSLYNNTPASWTAANIIVNSGGTLGLNVGGLGQFTSADLDTLLALGTATGGFKSGSFVGLDTTNAIGGSFTYSTAIADPFAGANVLGLTKLGTGTLILDVASSYTGATTISGGALQIGAGGSTGSLSTSSAIVNNANLTFNRSDTLTQGTHFNSVISGTGTVTQAGAGTTVLDGVNTYQGLTTVSAGTLRVGNAAGLGDTAAGTIVSSGAVLDLFGQTIGAEAVTINGTGISGGGALINSSGTAASLSGVVTLGTASSSMGGAGDLTLSGALAGNLAMIKVGAGALILQTAATRAGSATNNTTIDGGKIRIEHATAMSSGTTHLTIINTGGILELANGITHNQPITLNTGGTVRSDGNNTEQGKITVAAGAAVTLATVGSGDLFTVGNGASDVSGGDSSAMISIAGPGTIRLGTASNYTGNWNLTAGVTQLGAAAALGATPASTITLATGATLSPRLAALTTFTANPITLSGAGTATLLADRSSNGAGHAYTFGSLSIGSQTLAATNTSAFTSGAVGITLGPVTLTASPTFDVNLGAGGAASMTLTLGVIDDGASSFGITKTGTGTLTLSSANSFDGGLTLNAGVVLGANSALGTGTLTLNSGTLASVNNNSRTWSNTIVVGGDFTLGQAAGGTGALIFTGTVDLGGTTRQITVDNTPVAGDTFSNTISNGSLTKTGAGLLVLSGTNDYAGATTINGGGLAIGADNGLGVAPGAATPAHLTLNNGALATTATFTLNANRGIALDGPGGQINVTTGTILTYGGIAAGTGGLEKAGAGALVLANTSTYTGATAVTDGTLEVSGSLSGTTNVAVSTGGTLLLSGSVGDKVNDSASATLGGGTVAFSSGVAASLDEQVGVLTLSASSVIDFGTFAGGNTLRFADSTGATWTSGQTLSIWNWTAGADHLFFGSTFGGGVTAGQLGQVSFYSGAGTGFVGLAAYDAGGELSAIPEPATTGLLGVAGLLGLIGSREFRRRRTRAQPLS